MLSPLLLLIRSILDLDLVISSSDPGCLAELPSRTAGAAAPLLGSTMLRLVLAVALGLPTAGAGWKNLTVFHTNQANYSAGDIADMNTADDLVSL